MKSILLVLVVFLQVNVLNAQNIHDCLGAVPLCGASFHQASTISNVGNIPNEINTVNSSGACLTNEVGGVWYNFTPSTTGIFQFSITPDNPAGEDFDWALFDLTGANCSDLSTGDPSTFLVAGNTAGAASATPPLVNQGPTGINSGSAIPGGSNCLGPGAGDGSGTAPSDWNTFNPDVIVQAGNTYYLYVAQFSGSQGYTLDFTGSQASLFDTVLPVLVSASVVTCSSNQVEFTFSENILCSSVQDNEFTITGPGGPYTISGVTSIVCGASGIADSTFTGTITPSFSQTGNYTFHFNAATNGSVEDACGNLALSKDIMFPLTGDCAPPIANFQTANTSICINDCIDFNDLSTESPTVWKWYFYGATPDTSSVQNPTNICYNSAGSFDVALVSANSLGPDSLFIPNYIIVDSCIEIPGAVIIPNIFTPNGDGENDVFNIKGTSIDLVEMKIFNRWGIQLFETADIEKGWDGKNSGADAAAGTYFYIITVDIDGGNEIFKGSFTLMR